MIKELGVAALTAFSISTTDTSISEYQNLFSNLSAEQKLEVNQEQDFSISKEDKQYLETISFKNLKVLLEYKNRNEEVFKNNFDTWVIQESDSIDLLVTNILKESSLLSKAFKKEAKYYKKYPLISKQLLENSYIWDEIYKFTSPYKIKAREAKETYVFMSDFIEKNQEVLEALA